MTCWTSPNCTHGWLRYWLMDACDCFIDWLMRVFNGDADTGEWP